MRESLTNQARRVSQTLSQSNRQVQLLSAYFAVSLFLTVSIYFGRDVILPDPDYVEVWHPFAHEVMNGALPYTDVWDNKPPLFHFLNIGLYATGQHAVAWAAVIVTSNAVTALLLWDWAAEHGLGRAGVFAGFIFLLSLPVANGYTLDPRIVANVFILLAFLTDRIEYAGVSMATAGLLSQFSVLAIPAVAWYHVRGQSWDLRLAQTARFTIVGLTVFTASYLAVALIWNTQAAIDAVRFSVLSLDSYTEQFVERGKSGFASPLWLYQRMQERLQYAAVLFGLATIGFVSTTTGSDREHARFAIIVATTGVLLIVPIVIRGAPDYYVLMLPFAALLAGMGMTEHINIDWLAEEQD